MSQPPSESTPSGDDPDGALVAAAKSGDRQALHDLVMRHKPWIYNLAVRMVWVPAEAEDATQDVLIRMLKGLDGFEGRSRFRTWLYRIAINRLLSRPRAAMEDAAGSFDDYAAGLRSAPDQPLPELPEVERGLLVEEAKVACMTGMLLCLSREQRVAYVLGSVFALEDTVCAEILELPRATFRKRLSRARQDLHQFMQGQCGLVDESNPCRCARKTKTFIDRGFVDPARLKFVEARAKTVEQAAREQAGELFAAVTEDFPRLFRSHPFRDPSAILEGLEGVLRGTPLAGALCEPD